MNKRRIAVGAALALALVAGVIIVTRTDALVLLSSPEPDPTIGQPVSSANVFFIGHSLVGPDMPQMIGSFAQARGKGYKAHGQLGWGTTLTAHWEWDGVMNAAAPPGFPKDNRVPLFAGEAKAQLDTGSYDVLVLTESSGHTTISPRETIDYAARFVRRAREKNPRIRAYVYGSWGGRENFSSLAAWRAQMRVDQAWWERVADGVNARVSGPDVGVIPGATILAEVTEAIEKGQVPDIESPDELFLDQVHVNTLGFYVIALAHYAAIFRDDPNGLPAAVLGESGQPVAQSPTPAAAARLQALVWQHIKSYPRAAIAR